MTEAERMVWCAAFGAAVGAPDYYWRDEADDLNDGGRLSVAVERAARAVRLLGGQNSHLSDDAMLLAARG